jgi:pyruvate,water dikinase
VEEISAGRQEITQWSLSRLWTYHGALLDLAARAMAAELVVATDAAAIHAGLRAVLAHHLPSDVASRHSNALTVPTAVDAPLPEASAAVFAGPTWLEIGAAAPRAATPAIMRRDQAFDELVTELVGTPRWPSAGWRRVLRQRRLERLVTQAASQFERRERAKSALLEIGGQVRRIHLEFGRRLVDAGQLGRPVDVELLTVGELHRALAGQPVPPGTIERRRRWRERHEAHGPLPLRFTGVPSPAIESPAASTRQLTGWAGSAGTFVGKARRVDGPNGTIDRSEVLVATATDPSWSPLLMNCGAMVLERGGPLSHAAIVAGEFGVPAVFNVPHAVELLDGRRVRVDGDAGVVTVLDAELRS